MRRDATTIQQQRELLIFLTNEGVVTPFSRSFEVSLQSGMRVYSLTVQGTLHIDHDHIPFVFSSKGTNYRDSHMIVISRLLDYIYDKVDFQKPTPFGTAYSRPAIKAFNELCDRQFCHCPGEKDTSHSCFRFKRSTGLEFRISRLAFKNSMDSQDTTAV